jgi:hypothetical protein
LRRISISGSESAATLIISARVVPIATPLLSIASATGMMPVALEYSGMPTSTALGTSYQFPEARFCATQLSGTKPWNRAPTPMPSRTHFHIRPTISFTSPTA